MKRLSYLVLIVILTACTQATPETPNSEPNFSGTYQGLWRLPFETFDEVRALKVEFVKQSNVSYQATYTLSNEKTSSTEVALCSLDKDTMTCTDLLEETNGIFTFKGIITVFSWSGEWDIIYLDDISKGTFSTNKD